MAGAIRRQRQIDNLRAAQNLDLLIGQVRFEFDHGRLIEARVDGVLTAALPLPAPELSPLDRPLPRHAADETLCIARFIDANSQRIALLHCSGDWSQPIAAIASFEQRKAA